MLLFWKWKELYCGNSFAKFSKIRAALDGKNIKYSYKLVNRESAPPFRSPARNIFGRVGENSSVATMYYIYVYKSDYEAAGYAIRNA